jgi:hypothetical protein
MTLSPATVMRLSVGFAFALLLAWALRLDHLRAQHLADANRLLNSARTAIAAGKRLQIAAKDNADETDKRTAVTVDGFRAGVLRLPSAASACVTKARDTQGVDRPGGNPVGDDGTARQLADEVTVPRADMLICAANTGRLLEAHRWAITTEQLLATEAKTIEAAEAVTPDSNGRE